MSRDRERVEEMRKMLMMSRHVSSQLLGAHTLPVTAEIRTEIRKSPPLDSLIVVGPDPVQPNGPMRDQIQANRRGPMGGGGDKEP